MTDQMIFVKVNGWEDTTSNRKFGVRGYPTLILLRSDGTEIDRAVGYLPPEDFVQTMTDLAQGIGTLDAMLARLADNPNDAEACWEIGQKYYYRSEDSLATQYFTKVIEIDPQNTSGYADDAAFQFVMEIYYEGEERYDDAIAGFRDVIKQYPGSDMAEEAATYVPYILARQGKNAEALKLYEQFLKDYPESSEVDWVQGQIENLMSEGS